MRLLTLGVAISVEGDCAATLGAVCVERPHGLCLRVRNDLGVDRVDPDLLRDVAEDLASAGPAGVCVEKEGNGVLVVELDDVAGFDVVFDG